MEHGLDEWRSPERYGWQDGTDVVYVTPGYFGTLQIPVLAGRIFTDADSPNAQHAAVVNQAFARKFYGGANPVSRYINKDTSATIFATSAKIPTTLSSRAKAAIALRSATSIRCVARIFASKSLML